MPKLKSNQKDDTPVEMMKRVFAVAELIIQTDRCEEVRQKDSKPATKT